MPTVKEEGRFAAGELSLFCYQLSLIFKSGIPYLEGMSIFADEMADSRFKGTARQLSQDATNGKVLSESMENQKCFPAYMVNMVRMAEVSGTLDSGMENLSVYYEKMDKLKRKIMNAITYPIILSVLMGCIILLLILRILPMFYEILISVGSEIPPVTRVILNISLGIRDNWAVILVVILAVVAVCLIFARTGAGKRKWDEFKVKAPLFKKINLKVISARFGMGMSMLLKGGISFDDSLGMVGNIVGNKYVGGKIAECRQAILKGEDSAEAFIKTGVFPPLFYRMFHMGYKTGELEKTMQKISDIYETEADKHMGRITSAIEPILVIILSLIVGIILLAILLPLINIMSSIG
ncbi:MAG: type II secretion system F family protein [Clostridiales bacterium]|nr:type II secretion system F family protein [Clostridiales bacterium]